MKKLEADFKHPDLIFAAYNMGENVTDGLYHLAKQGRIFGPKADRLFSTLDERGRPGTRVVAEDGDYNYLDLLDPRNRPYLLYQHTDTNGDTVFKTTASGQKIEKPFVTPQGLRDPIKYIGASALVASVMS